MTPVYDYAIVGAGLFGATFAQQMTASGRSCLVIDKRKHVAGNCYTEEIDGTIVHMYGPHAFHTNNARIWNYVNRYAEFSQYRHKVYAKLASEQLVSLPINLNTFGVIAAADTPERARQYLREVVDPTVMGDDIESWCYRNIGSRLYKMLIRDYTAKQWGRQPRDLPSSIIERLPIRFTYNNDYSNDRWQGIPLEGYTPMVERMLEGASVCLGVDFFEHRDDLHKVARKIVYSGPIDQLFDCDQGALEYRALRFEHQRLSVADFQGTAQVNYMALDIPYTRITEHKHFDPTRKATNLTVITREYPESYTAGGEPAYPITDERNSTLAAQYIQRAKDEGYIVGGRLGRYQYMDMHQVIAQALAMAEKELHI